LLPIALEVVVVAAVLAVEAVAAVAAVAAVLAVEAVAAWVVVAAVEVDLAADLAKAEAADPVVGNLMARAAKKGISMATNTCCCGM
jgi:hypothetical protein